MRVWAQAARVRDGSFGHLNAFGWLNLALHFLYTQQSLVGLVQRPDAAAAAVVTPDALEAYLPAVQGPPPPAARIRVYPVTLATEAQRTSVAAPQTTEVVPEFLRTTDLLVRFWHELAYAFPYTTAGVSLTRYDV